MCMQLGIDIITHIKSNPCELASIEDSLRGRNKSELKSFYILPNPEGILDQHIEKLRLLLKFCFWC